MDSLPVFDIKNSCRICLACPTEQVSLWEYKKLDETIYKQLAEMFEECTSVKVEEDGFLSEIICPECLPMLITMYIFRKRCIETNTYLDKLISEINKNLIEKVTVKEDFLEDEELALADTTNTPKQEHREYKVRKPTIKAKCQNCNKIFTTERCFERHCYYCAGKEIVKTSSNDSMIETLRYACDICHVEFDTKPELEEHFFDHVAVATYFDFKQDDNLFFCYACDKKHLKGEMDMRKHFKTHKKYVCKTCHKSYKRLALAIFSKHLKNHGVRPHICQICLISFQTEAEATIHVTNHFKNDSKSIYECSLCVDKFTNCSELKEHIKIHFEAVHYCSECCMPFNDLVELELHTKVHKATRLCPDCGKTCENERQLQIHVNRYHTALEPHSCDICHKIFSSIKLLTRHKKLHIKPRSCPFARRSEPALADTGNVGCHNCTKRFETEKLLAQHLFYCIPQVTVKTDSNDSIIETPSFPCDICHVEFDTSTKLAEHFYSHVTVATYFDFKHDDDLFFCYACDKNQLKDEIDCRQHFQAHLTDYTCRVCQKSYPTNGVGYGIGKLRKHLKIHGVWPHICQICLISFETEEEATNHVTNHRQNDSKTSYECAFCDDKFTSCSQLKEHAKIHSKGIYYCDCGMVFDEFLVMQSHRKRHGTDLKREGLCAECGLTFNNENSLKYHIQRHHIVSEKPYTCDICDISFPNRLIHRDHMRTRHDIRRYSCPFAGCSYISKEKASVKKHIRCIHTDERPYKCTYNGCTQAFKISGNYHAHLRRHYGIKNHACSFCDLKFITRSEATEHSKTHIDTLSYSCDICGKKFRMASYMRCHKRKIHKTTSKI